MITLLIVFDLHCWYEPAENLKISSISLLQKIFLPPYYKQLLSYHLHKSPARDQEWQKSNCFGQSTMKGDTSTSSVCPGSPKLLWYLLLVLLNPDPCTFKRGRRGAKGRKDGIDFNRSLPTNISVITTK